MPEVLQEDDASYWTHALLSAVSDVERLARANPRGLADEHSRIVEARNRLDAILVAMKHREVA